mmetsp:Transcript_572/g.1021  ORF Transcript_572/g.1021 Transcript_572/m.1021 type:complete len:668 (+) Transcript_572:79-2082(+)|eukprot:CAMPEP_0176483742 /NCGR_PEP_ID=MMETSP0200_2-20121128/4082_1 /TAXON_ID=947934 /ORGANISM="Chaetoceros sp., Strain GSL56" /LENGTH=667 /DNA_ID=CAMNT_0017880167 /DNA_START=11 /DNA_END=2014 /DNA_ORIENTATION=-
MSSTSAIPSSNTTNHVAALVYSILCNEEALFHILSFVDEQTRESFVFVSVAHSKILTSEASYFWRCQRLHLERGIFFSCGICPNDTWKNVFYRNYVSRRNLWSKASSCRGEEGPLTPVCDSKSDQFKLTVSARLRPRNLIGSSEGSYQFPRKDIALPLHQRLALIRMSRNITSPKEAFHVLMKQGGWFHNSSDESDEIEHREDDESKGEDGQSQNIQYSMKGGVHAIDTVNNAVILVDRTKGLRRFEFDHVFCDQSNQETIYKRTVMPLVADFINGYNATCLVYGQTGSGKTYSMFGPHVHESFGFGSLMLLKDGDQVQVPDNLGIVPRAIKEIFDAVEYRNTHLSINIQARVSLSYIEIYGDDISDLLRNGANCGQSRVAAQRYVLDGSSEVIVPTLQEAVKLLNRGETQKRKAATALNARSSRAHTLFIVTLQQECVESGVTATSRLFLVDLGGSEQIKRSQPYNKLQGNKVLEKQRIQEAININLGLLALKQCVQALVQKRKHIPYGDSKLTMMLSSGLGGDCKTSLIVCGAQEEHHGPETIAAMNFGQTCRGIYNSAKSNANMLKNLLNNLDEKISQCEKNIRENEAWEEIDDERFDDEGNMIEVRKKTVVTGADVFRRELASLLRQKAELIGETIDDQLYSNNLEAVEGFGDFHQYTAEHGL